MLPKICEVKNDYTDDDNYTTIDVWDSEDENAEGKVVAIVCMDTGKVYFIDNLYRGLPEINEAITEVLRRIHPDSTETYNGYRFE